MQAVDSSKSCGLFRSQPSAHDFFLELIQFRAKSSVVEPNESNGSADIFAVDSIEHATVSCNWLPLDVSFSRLLGLLLLLFMNLSRPPAAKSASPHDTTLERRQWKVETTAQ